MVWLLFVPVYIGFLLVNRWHFISGGMRVCVYCVCVRACVDVWQCKSVWQFIIRILTWQLRWHGSMLCQLILMLSFLISFTPSSIVWWIPTDVGKQMFNSPCHWDLYGSGHEKWHDLYTYTTSPAVFTLQGFTCTNYSTWVVAFTLIIYHQTDAHTHIVCIHIKCHCT